jgi:hypothetical protein
MLAAGPRPKVAPRPTAEKISRHVSAFSSSRDAHFIEHATQTRGGHYQTTTTSSQQGL